MEQYIQKTFVNVE